MKGQVCKNNPQMLDQLKQHWDGNYENQRRHYSQNFYGYVETGSIMSAGG
jgi:hypothetical protein